MEPHYMQDTESLRLY